MFAYCGNNPICYSDSSGFSSKISYGEGSDIMGSPWKDSMGGGGYNMVASGYVLLAGMKYSKKEEIRDFYTVAIQLIEVSSYDDLKNTISHYIEWRGEAIFAEGEILIGVYKIRSGVKKITSPFSTPFKRVKGVVQIAIGVYKVIKYGIRSIAE